MVGIRRGLSFIWSCLPFLFLFIFPLVVVQARIRIRITTHPSVDYHNLRTALQGKPCYIGEFVEGVV